VVHTHAHIHNYYNTCVYKQQSVKKINAPSKRESSKVRTKLNRSTKHVLVTSRQLNFRNYLFKMISNSCAVRFNFTCTLQYLYCGTVCVVIHERTVCRWSILVRRMECTPRAFLLYSSFTTYLCIFLIWFFSKTSPGNGTTTKIFQHSAPLLLFRTHHFY